MRIKTGFLVLSVLGLGAAEAMAQPQVIPPPACQAGPNLDSFRAGAESGQSLARQAWNAMGTNACFSLERYASVLTNNVKRLIVPAGANNDYVHCRHAGIVQGVLRQVDVTWKSCEVECCGLGKPIAEMTGELYCNTAIDLGGVGVDRFLDRLPVTLCPFNVETCCDFRFIEYTRAFRNEAGVACLPYTQPPYELAWDQARNNSCISSPP
ncbi:hypothetical protein [Polyangium aurulentum]|uniref:hypothetical protein n=1 Tax=Polyangium aurulentum TaxID=2567896 RepID=UPI0010AEA8CF|nr:hypothetical protein [Polyangium aurulentum]UQA59535.1 hypothetical protein E8A73_003205 [Polyangium aurulentum]